MRHDYQPVLTPVKIADLRPTQMTVGFHEVQRKRQDWAELGRKSGDFLGRHMIPVVQGPRKRLWLVDHHHLARALIEEGETHVLVSVLADLSRVAKDEFLTVMDNRSWLHPFDARGVRRDYGDIPHRIAKLADDPFRSVAGALRRMGGYAKSETPFSEFLWADFLRRRIDAKLAAKDFDKALREALALAHSRDAAHLPGWVGQSA